VSAILLDLCKSADSTFWKWCVCVCVVCVCVCRVCVCVVCVCVCMCVCVCEEKPVKKMEWQGIWEYVVEKAGVRHRG